MILDDAPVDRAIREELYMACAKKTYNGFFSRIRLPEGTSHSVPSKKLGGNSRIKSKKPQLILQIKGSS